MSKDIDMLNKEQKQARFDEYFMIACQNRANIALWPQNQALPSEPEFLARMPDAFRIASEISNLDQTALRPLRHLGDHATDLAEFLNLQSRKIDLIMSYVLSMQDDPQSRFICTEFGGGGLVYISDAPVEEGQTLEVKLFLEDEGAAIYCLGEVLQSESAEQGHKISVVYTLIREEDREVLVRASLHQQSKQLKKISEQRKLGK